MHEQGGRVRTHRTAIASVCALALMLTLVACGSIVDDAERSQAPLSPEGSGTPLASAAPEATEGSCGWRHVNPEDPIQGELFARCVVDATIQAGTAVIDSQIEGGRHVTGPVTFREPISAHLTSASDGIEQIFIGETAWMSQPGGTGWVEGNPNGNPSEQMVADLAQAYGAAAAPETIRAQLASAEEWTPTVTDTIDGIAVQGFTGTPVQKGVDYDGFTVWITEDDRPMRFEQHGTGYGGYPFSATMDFSEYGEPVDISAP